MTQDEKEIIRKAAEIMNKMMEEKGVSKVSIPVGFDLLSYKKGFERDE